MITDHWHASFSLRAAASRRARSKARPGQGESGKYVYFIEQLLKEFVSVVVNNEHNVEICWKMIHLHRIRDIKKKHALGGLLGFSIV